MFARFPDKSGQEVRIALSKSKGQSRRVGFISLNFFSYTCELCSAELLGYSLSLPEKRHHSVRCLKLCYHVFSDNGGRTKINNAD